MEPVSLSIGAVGLMALLKTCVECFEYIGAAKTYGRNLELLTTKFAVEQARLLIWGESVGISSTNPTGSNRVETPHVRPIVEQILNCIRLLFEDTNALTVRYGLKCTDNEAPSSALLLAGPVDSPGLPLRLKASYVRFKSRIKLNHKQTSTTKKAKWAIRDEKKFTSLVEEIHQLIDGLESVTNSAEIATKRAALIREELSTVEDHEDLRLIAEATADGNQQWSDAASLALGASVCGASIYDHVRDWISAVSDGRRSTTADCAESALSWDLAEASPSKLLAGLEPHLNGSLFPVQWDVKADSPFGDLRGTEPGLHGYPLLLTDSKGELPESLDAYKHAFERNRLDLSVVPHNGLDITESDGSWSLSRSENKTQRCVFFGLYRPGRLPLLTYLRFHFWNSVTGVSFFLILWFGCVRFFSELRFEAYLVDGRYNGHKVRI